MLIPNPILIGPTPAGGVVLPVTADRGGLAGYVLLGQHGPAMTVELSTGTPAWTAPTYPHTLSVGELLRLTRTDGSPTLTTLRMLAPVDDDLTPSPEGPTPGTWTTTTDAEGFEAIEADAITDTEGFQTIQNATATTDAEGYQTPERSIP